MIRSGIVRLQYFFKVAVHFDLSFNQHHPTQELFELFL
jgi:hypothetical protein